MINHMNGHNERILLVESDPQISQLISVQSLKPLGFLVDVFESGASVVQEIGKIAPDVIITDLNLPGLSCKDLMVALASCGVNVPIVVIANKGQEADILQTFRLGAVDFLFCPIRETEVIAVIENTLSKQRARRELEIYSKKLNQTTAAMEQQLGDFSDIFSFIKQAYSIIDTELLYEKLADMAIKLTQADSSWVLTLDANQEQFILRACQNVPDTMQSNLNLPYEDELCSLTMLSGQVVSIHGDALKRFTGLEWIGAALAVPVTHDGKVNALIAAARNAPQAFTASQQAMLELAAEYTWILLENTLRLHQMEQNLVYLRQANIHATLESNLKYDLLRQSSLEVRRPLKALMENVDALLDDAEHKLSREQATLLNDIQEEAEILMDISDSMLISRQEESLRSVENIDLNETVRNVVNRFRPIAQMGRIMINLELPSEPSMIRVYPGQITKVIEGLLSNALKYSPSNGEVTIRIDHSENDTTLTVNDQGDGMDENLADRVFEINSGIFGYSARRFGGIGISLATIKEIISAYKGQIWIDRLQDTGFTIAFSLPRG
jgi:K+-sensing histidine kinase KdpD/FixJ family two-component response regulator